MEKENYYFDVVLDDDDYDRIRNKLMKSKRLKINNKINPIILNRGNYELTIKFKDDCDGILNTVKLNYKTDNTIYQLFNETNIIFYGDNCDFFLPNYFKNPHNKKLYIRYKRSNLKREEYLEDIKKVIAKEGTIGSVKLLKNIVIFNNFNNDVELLETMVISAILYDRTTHRLMQNEINLLKDKLEYYGYDEIPNISTNMNKEGYKDTILNITLNRIYEKKNVNKKLLLQKLEEYIYLL